jgi:hypothetical protein
MAIQIGDIKIRGTIAGITFYKMEGQWYARRQSSLTGKGVKSDPRFRRTMASAQRLALGSQLASRVYRALPCTAQVYTLFCRLKSAAIQALKEGSEVAEVKGLLETITGRDNKMERRKYEGKRTGYEVPRAKKKANDKKQKGAIVWIKGQRQLRCSKEALQWVNSDGMLERKVRTTLRMQPMANAP